MPYGVEGCAWWTTRGGCSRATARAQAGSGARPWIVERYFKTGGRAARWNTEKLVRHGRRVSPVSGRL